VGDWRDVPASKLVYPLDTHIFKAGRALGLTRRGQADLRAAVEVTEGFGRIAPDDPVRYDFALAHLGFRGELDVFLRSVQDGAKFVRIPGAAAGETTGMPAHSAPEAEGVSLRRKL